MLVAATPHNACIETEDIAKTVLMPGDPLRAEFIANKFLTNVTKFNEVRGMFGFTGFYKGRRISVMGSGMGMPSIGIYAYELFNHYGVERIVRIGTAGSYSPELNLFDVVLAKDAYSESSFAEVFCGDCNHIQKSDPQLNNELLMIAHKLNKEIYPVRIHSSDVFYRLGGTDYEGFYKDLNCACVEMESFALFSIAKQLHKQAACVLTISDSFHLRKETTSEERQKAFHDMMEIALELAE